MTIRVTPRDDEHRTCPYCRDEVTVGPSCASCGTLYHTECAMTFALCATLGCQQRLTAAGDAVALPRISALARRLSHWRVDGLGPRGPQALILEPSPGAHDRDDAALDIHVASPRLQATRAAYGDMIEDRSIAKTQVDGS